MYTCNGDLHISGERSDKREREHRERITWSRSPRAKQRQERRPDPRPTHERAHTANRAAMHSRRGGGKRGARGARGARGTRSERRKMRKRGEGEDLRRVRGLCVWEQRSWACGWACGWALRARGREQAGRRAPQGAPVGRAARPRSLWHAGHLEDRPAPCVGTHTR